MDGAVKGRHQTGQILVHLQASGAVEVAERQVGIGDQLHQRPWVRYGEGVAGFSLLRFHHLAIPELEADRRRAGHAQQFGNQPAFVAVGFPLNSVVFQRQGQRVAG